MLIILCFLCLPFLWQKATDQFRLGKLAYDLQSPKWNVMADAGPYFDQPFTYLSHGAQSFVFTNGEWTLKLFRHDRFIHPWRKWIRNSVLKKAPRLPFDQKIDHLFLSAKLAFEQAADLTGLVYLHLNRTENILPTITIKDALGRSYLLDLNRVSFAVQYRARPFNVVLQEADPEKRQRLIANFHHLLEERIRRKIRNGDTKINPNFGFYGETAMEWDFGNYWIDENIDPEDEMKRFVNTEND